MKPLVLYHANCPDGFCAAWVANTRFGGQADFIPVQYGEAPPDVKGRDVYILDFSFKRPVMEQLRRGASYLAVLDHHKTAQQELDGFGAWSTGAAPSWCTFDMNKSGGRLAWEYFFPDLPYTPWLVKYTEDRDLWKWELPDSREINAALASYPRTFEKWNELDVRNDLHNIALEGQAILRYQTQLIDSICATAREVEIDGYKVLAANTPVLISEVAGNLAKDRPFGAAWFIRSDSKKQWSLRSRDGEVDVSEVAKRHGGGGHRNAAGYQEGS